MLFLQPRRLNHPMVLAAPGRCPGVWEFIFNLCGIYALSMPNSRMLHEEGVAAEDLRISLFWGKKETVLSFLPGSPPGLSSCFNAVVL